MAEPRPLDLVSEKTLAEGIRQTPLSHVVLWTGDPLRGLAYSRLARALACVRQANQPLSLRELVQRAARIDGQLGVDPKELRLAIRQHQAASPSVLLLLERKPDGSLIAVTDIPMAGAQKRRIRQGEVVSFVSDLV